MVESEKIKEAAPATPTAGLPECEDEDNELETDLYQNESFRSMFMSNHFVFPPSQHENLPLEMDVPRLDVEIEDIFDQSEQENDGFEEVGAHDELVEHQNVAKPESRDPSILDVNSPTDHSKHHLSPAKYSHKGSVLPCEAWWKRVHSFYAQVKEANKVWSICVAATLLGLVILGQRYQQGRWQIHHRWKLGINDEKWTQLIRPVLRLKDVIIGAQHRDSFITGSSSTNRQ